MCFENSEEERQNVSVDLMLDASASRMGHEAVIAAQGYVIAESLTRCGIPVQVYSFSTIQNYTVMRLFRGYEEKEKTEEFLTMWQPDGTGMVWPSGQRAIWRDSPPARNACSLC